METGVAAASASATICLKSGAGGEVGSVDGGSGFTAGGKGMKGGGGAGGGGGDSTLVPLVVGVGAAATTDTGTGERHPRGLVGSFGEAGKGGGVLGSLAFDNAFDSATRVRGDRVPKSCAASASMVDLGRGEGRGGATPDDGHDGAVPRSCKKIVFRFRGGMSGRGAGDGSSAAMATERAAAWVGVASTLGTGEPTGCCRFGGLVGCTLGSAGKRGGSAGTFSLDLF